MPRLRPAPKKEEEIEEIVPQEPQLFGAKEPEPEEKTEPEVKPEPEKQEEDPTLALKKQVEELTKSEELQRTRAEQAVRERQEALKWAQEREVEVVKFQKEATQSQYDSIASALAGAQAEAERATQEVEIAGTNQDWKALSEAQRRLARAEARIDKLEDGKFELESRIKVERAKPEPKIEQRPRPQDPLDLDKSNLPDSAKTYLRAHPDLITDPRKNARLQAWHWDAIDAGKDAFSKEYFEFIDEKRDPKKIEPEPQQQQRTNIVSAPVSREVPSGGTGSRQGYGKITLTAEQKDSARIAGVTETEYAKQLIRLNELKANGQYTGGQ